MTDQDEEILNPFADEVEAKGTVLADRLSTVGDARIGLFSNTKKNADHFLREVGERLEADHAAEVSEVVYKDVATSAADEAVYEELREYDAVLIAYGDCGSCSSWTMHDAFQLEEAGVPTVVFCTEEFTTLCQYEAENQGVPGLPIVEIEHPIADLSPEAVASDRVTDDILTAVTEALTNDAGELLDLYKGKYTDAASSELA
ncbi:UGSC family (seleno)protein [Natronomonas gomsonensis]|uniref:UGSC family (seleno)protein n=1 Tax=Natronomonas gomsonensis TaxID=1046043 RepID=UPI0015BD3D3A|nr:UGSC family (seleno)protein [Natronomonas gomsonensis]